MRIGSIYARVGPYAMLRFSIPQEVTMATAKEKQKAVEFSHDYGIRTAADAWDKLVSTIYNWRKRFREGGKLALKDQSRHRGHLHRQ